MVRGFSSMSRGLALSAKRSPNRPALVEIDRLTLTYAELLNGAIRLANHLRRKGARPGDNIGILSANSIEHMISLYGVSFAGGVSVAFDPKWTASEISRTIDAFDCRIVICDGSLSRLLTDERRTGISPEIISYSVSKGSCDLVERLRDESAEPPPVHVNDDDPCTILLTSGTTGVPKGVVRSSRNVETGCLNGVMGKAQTDNGRELAVVPIFYGSGRGSVVGQIYLGATVYVMPSFDAEHAAHVIDREKITAIALAPTMCRRLLRMPNLGHYDFTSLRSLRKAGSPFTLGMASEISERITANIYQGYASTETGSVSLLGPEEQFRKLGSAGRLEWGVEADVVDDAGNPLGPDEDGEVRVRGPSVCQGYYKNPDEEKKAFRDGWFHTGDIGRFDRDGYLFIVGRIKETIKTGSINVSPREVELTIGGVAGVEDVAVIGVPDMEWGEAVTAFVVRSPGSNIDDRSIDARCREVLSGYKIPKRIQFVTEIERNALGKVTPAFREKMKSPTR